MSEPAAAAAAGKELKCASFRKGGRAGTAAAREPSGEDGLTICGSRMKYRRAGRRQTDRWRKSGVRELDSSMSANRLLDV